jgi:exopolysaccharide biosynthesis protein
VSFVKLFIGSTILVIAIIYLANRGDQTKLVYNSETTPDTVKNISVNNQNYAYYFWELNPVKTKLIGNFSEKMAAKTISVNNDCLVGINGSFYDENSRPLGWWLSDGKTLKDFTKNSLLNGYVSLNSNEELVISKEKPAKVQVWGMQAGPVLIMKGKSEILSMANDKPARRSVVGREANGKLLALSVFDQNSRFDGPTMTELPTVVTAIANREQLVITDAINLDGGAASAFYSSTDKLPEVVAVGSWICGYK